MSKILTLVLVMLVLTGCETVKGAATGMGQDLQNTADNAETLAKNSVNPDKNGWNALKKADDWAQKNLW